MPSRFHSSNARVFVLALDGATYDLLGPWMEQGHLPNLKALYEAGVHAPLESTYPPLTGPAWASFMTGKDPSSHSLLEFFRREPDSYRQVLNSRHDIDGRSIWRVLSDAGKQVVVLGVPLTWPPEQVNGCLITGLLTPRQDDVVFTHPPELGDELRARPGGYLLQHTEKYVQDDPMRLAREEWAILENKVDTALYLLQSKPWDFFMLHILGCDVLQHGFWHYMDPEHVQHKPEEGEKYGHVIRDYFQRFDRRLPEILSRLPQNTTVLVMSDHGFGRLRKYINFNTWLLNKGYLKIRRNLWSQLRYLGFRLGYSYKLAWEIGARTGIVRRVIKMGRGQQESVQRKVFLSLDDVDWPRTTAYSIGNFGQMFLNVKGREPQGTVAPGADYERALGQLEADLRAMRDPDTSQPVVDRIWRGDEIWQGKYAGCAPDLFFFTRNYEYKAMGLSDFGSNAVFEDLYGTRAHHHLHGIFMMAGPEVKQNQPLSHARLIDLAPTIYHLMGVPLPADLDGQVLREAFTGGPATRPPQYETPRASGNGDRPDEVYTAEEEAALTEMLRDLGYVS
ncbi:MAG: alkaline phosphatase family protein [Chloroflexi bacterium]|nr:alkaline phosphatase family protein [Chloroflexota bacterium]